VRGVMMPRLLLAYHTDPARIPPAVFDPGQVICGPFVADRHDGERVAALRTPVGAYDIGAVVARLPAAQRPEVLIVKADATQANLPRGIAALGIPAILVVGDTHHLARPLRTMLAYALSEPFVATVLGHNRQHLHWFSEAGCARPSWVPGALWHDHPVPFLRRRERRAVLVAHYQRYHAQRRRVIDALKASGRPVLIGQTTPPQAALYHATSLATLNCSLNGDLNLRVFEAMAAGGCLVTDRLSPQSGLDQLFRDGTHLLLHDGIDDLLATIDRLLADPATALAIATAARARVREAHGLAARWAAFESLFAGRALDPAYRAAAEPRAVHAVSGTAADRERRLALYEHVQERHRLAPALTVVALPGADPLMLCDLADLTRLRLWRTTRNHDRLLGDAGVLDRIGLLDPGAADGRPWDLALLGGTDAASLAWVAAVRPGMVALPAAPAGVEIPGYLPAGPDAPGVYERR